MTNRKPSVILIGLPSGHHSIPEAFKPKVKELLEATAKSITDAGYDYQFFGVTPEEGVEPLIERLKEKNLDGICIGFGVRGQKELTPFFEDIVNAIVQHGSGIPLAFNDSLETTLESIKRRVPI